MNTCSPRVHRSGRHFARTLSWHGSAALVLAACCAVGCLELPRESTPITYWTLAPLAADATAGAADGSAQRTLAVGPLSLPAYVDRAEIMHRAGSHQLIVERFDHWAGSLDEQIPRVLAQDIMALAPSILASPYPEASGGRPDYQLVVTLLAFEVDAAGELQLQATWKLVDTNNGVSLARTSTHLSESAGDRSVEQIVAAMSRALGGLAQRVVDALP